jgi:tripartite-type tricarboxylate transporter receptor subunit TctC
MMPSRRPAGFANSAQANERFAMENPRGISPFAHAALAAKACCVALLLAASGSAALAAEPFCPESAVKIVVPFPPGGPTDISARLLSERLRDRFGQNVIVEARAGASGSIGTGYVAQQPGNGCTILLAYDTHGVNPALYALPFDTMTAFKPVMLVGTIPNTLALHVSQPWKTLDELMAAAKKTELVYASGASAGVAHFSMKLIEQLYGVELRHVPYKGAAPAVQDLMGGHVPMMMGSVLALAPAISAGKARALVQTGAKRHPLLPDTPTVAELGHPGFSTASWIGIFLPAGASDALVTRLHDDLAAVLQDAFIRDRLAAIGVELVGSSPAELGTFVNAEIARWTDVIKRYNIKPE